MIHELTLGLPAGTNVTWRTLDGRTHFGMLKEYDNGTAIVVVDGKEMAVRCV